MTMIRRVFRFFWFLGFFILSAWILGYAMFFKCTILYVFGGLVACISVWPWLSSKLIKRRHLSADER